MQHSALSFLFVFVAIAMSDASLQERAATQQRCDTQTLFFVVVDVQNRFSLFHIIFIIILILWGFFEFLLNAQGHYDYC